MANGDKENKLLRHFEGDPDPETPLPSGNKLLRHFADEAGMFREGVIQYENQPIPTTAGDAFLRGVGRGTTFPLQLVGVEQPESIAETPGQKIAEVAGEFAGFGLGYLPFSVGAGLTLRGIGLTAKMGPRLNAFVRGTLAGGTFELGGDETLEGGAGRFAFGAALGGPAEALFIGKAAGQRAKLPKPDDSIAHPDLIALEQAMRPTEAKSSAEIARTLVELGDEAAQYETVVGNLSQVFNANGFAIIPGLREPAKLMSHIKRLKPQTQTLVRKGDDGLSEVLLFDPETGTRLLNDPAASQELRAFMGSGERLMNFDQALALVRRPGVPGERITPPEVKTQPGLISYTNRYGQEGKALGLASVVDDLIKIKSPSQYEFETLVHEYTHMLMTIQNPSTGGRFWARLRDVIDVPIDEMVPPHMSPEEFDIGDLVTWNASLFDPADELPPILRELRDVTLEVEQIKGFSKKEVRDLVFKDWEKYYGEEQELMARMVQLMAMDPKKARELAPMSTKLFSEFIMKESPKLQMMLSRADLRNLDDLIKIRWQQSTPGGPVQFLRETGIKITKKLQQQFKREGGVSGMTVFHGGKEFEWAGLTRAAKDHVRLFDPRKKKSFEVPVSEVQRPVLPRMAQISDELTKQMDEILSESPDWVGFAVRHPEGGVQRGVVELGNYEQATSFVDYARRNRAGVIQGRKLSEIEDLRAEVGRHLDEIGSDGLLINDNGKMRIVPTFKGQQSIRMGERLSDNFGVAIDEAGVKHLDEGLVIEHLSPSFRNLTESVLRTHGASDREIAFYLRQSENISARRYERLLDGEFRTVAENALKRPLPGVEIDASSAAASHGLKAEKTVTGQTRVLSEDNVQLGLFDNEAQAKSFMAKAGTPEMKDLDEGVSLTSAAATRVREGRVAPPPKVQSQMPIERTPKDMGKARRFINATKLTAARLVPLESVARAIENLGLGPAWRAVYEPTQAAIVKVDNALEAVKRAGLEDRTFNEVLNKISGLQAGLTKSQQERSIRYVEFMTKDEVAKAGGLLQRGMNELEKNIAGQLEKMGLGHDVPRLMQTNRVMESLIGNQNKFLKDTYPRYLARIDAGEIPEDFRPVIERLRAQAEEGTKLSKQDLMKQMDLTEDEQWVINMLDDPPSSNLDEFSIMAVSRYASAPELKPGFKSGREMYAAEQGMTKREIELAKELDLLFQASFAESGLNSKRMLGGFWPHFRQYAEHGIGIADGDTFFKDQIPEAVEWISGRVRTGELDLYSMDPFLVGRKHVRNMLMKKHFDPILPDVKAALGQIAKRDTRSGRIMTEYLSELMGETNESFTRLNELFQSIGRSLGVELDPRTGEKLINTLTGLAYQAAIPFRPALIMRNYLQMEFMIAPVLGQGSFNTGLRKAMTREGFEEAVKAGVIDLNVVPLHASDEILGMSTSRISEELGPKVAQAGFKWKALFDKGFDWYRKGDDVGRAVAYHAAKSRQNKYLQKYLDGDIDIERFKELAKVKTFDETTEVEWERLITVEKNYEKAAVRLGTDLAKKAHFRYGHANHPYRWGGVTGRLFGQFGSFPVQYVDALIEGSTRGTAKDIAEFWTMHAGLNAAVVAGGAELFGLDLVSWATLPSINYTGGPYADAMINMVQMFGGSEAESSMAKRNLGYLFPTLENPQSIFVPGSYLLGDVVDGLSEPDFTRATGEAAGFKFMEPGEDNAVQKLLDRLIPDAF